VHGIATTLSPQFELCNVEGIKQQSRPSGADGEDQVEHIDIGGGYPCRENCPVSCKCNLVNNLRCYESAQTPSVVWMPMEKEISIIVFIFSHEPALKCLEYFVNHSWEFRESWIQRNPGKSDEWRDAFVDHVTQMLRDNFRELEIKGKRLLVTEQDLVIMHGLLVHSGTDDDGARLVAMLLCEVCFLFFFVHRTAQRLH